MPLLDAEDMATLQRLLHQGSANASESLAKWIERPSVVELDALASVTLQQASTVLGSDEAPICFCSVTLSGSLGGEMVLAFDDASGLALADTLLGNPDTTSREWDELSTSSALETANIVCCAYLNALSRSMDEAGLPSAIIPSPPSFRRDFAESLMEFVMMTQAVAYDELIIARTRFQIDRTDLNWTLLFVPDAQTMTRLPDRLARLRQGR